MRQTCCRQSFRPDNLVNKIKQSFFYRSILIRNTEKQKMTSTYVQLLWEPMETDPLLVEDREGFLVMVMLPKLDYN